MKKRPDGRFQVLTTDLDFIKMLDNGRTVCEWSAGRIHGTDYQAITDLPTAKKSDWLDDHLEIVGLSDEAAEKIKDRLRREF